MNRFSKGDLVTAKDFIFSINRGVVVSYDMAGFYNVKCLDTGGVYSMHYRSIRLTNTIIDEISNYYV